MFLQKKEREERERREGKDDRSFFQKYVSQSQEVASHALSLPSPLVGVYSDRCLLGHDIEQC